MNPLWRRKTAITDGLLVPQPGNSFFDLVKDDPQYIPMIAWPRTVLTGCRSSGRRMKVVSRIVRVRMSVPPALPGVIRMHLSVMDFEIVVRVPANSEIRLLYGFRIVRWCKCHIEFEMSTRIRDRRSSGLCRGLEACLKKLEHWAVDRRGATSISCRRRHRWDYPDAWSVSAPARC